MIGFMEQSPLHTTETRGFHVAIIMDGNGRWAHARRWPRAKGHSAGVEAVGRIVDAAPAAGIRTLTLFAFSSDNWRRPHAEIARLMRLVQTFLLSKTTAYAERGVRVTVIGRRDRLSRALLGAVEAAEAATVWGRTMDLRLAIDYSARDAIVRAAMRLAASRSPSRDAFARLLAEVDRAAPPAPDVDLLIRTGGEKRLSDFLLWESAYAELYFTDRCWPEFEASDLEAAVREFRRRERRFGMIGRVPGTNPPNGNAGFSGSVSGDRLGPWPLDRVIPPACDGVVE
jgi:undecaprenyl diphosphate synthase